MPTVRGRLAAGAVVLTCLAAACSSGPPGPTTSPTTAVGRLPPQDFAGLAPIIDPLVRPLDLALTRANLVDRTTGAPGPASRHLALYVQPIRDFSDTELVQAIVPLARVLTPFVFRQWPGLESYDICQELLPGVDDRLEPETLTILDVSRQYAEAVNWRRVQLSALVADTRKQRPGIVVGVTERLQPILQAAAG